MLPLPPHITVKKTVDLGGEIYQSVMTIRKSKKDR
jgi:hypothetical protein